MLAPRRRRTLLRAALLPPLLFILTAAAACDQPKRTDILPDAQQLLRVESEVSGDALQTLDPVLAMDGGPGSLQPYALLYSGLVTYDANPRPVLWDADRLAVSPDGTVYMFHLRQNLRFSDSTPITSADVAYSLDRTAGPCTATIRAGFSITSPELTAGFLSDLKDADVYREQTCAQGHISQPAAGHATVLPSLIGDAIQTPDPSTVTLVLAHPDGAFLLKLALPYASIVERTVIERYGDDWSRHLMANGGQGTSGLYKVAASSFEAPSDLPSQPTLRRLTLVRDANWWGAKPRLREVNMAFSGFTNMRHDYLAGKADLITSLGVATADSPIPYDAARHDPGYHEAPEPEIDGLALSLSSPPTDDVRVRQAIALALDKTKLAGARLALPRGVPTNHLIPQGVPDYAPNLSGPVAGAPLTGDPQAAAAQWRSYVADVCHGEASRCAPIDIGISLCGPPGVQPEVMANMVGGMLQAALSGVRVTYEKYGGSCVFFVSQEPRRCGRVPVYGLYLGADYPDPSSWLSSYFVPQPGDIVSCPGDDRAVTFLRAADATSGDARAQLYRQAEQQLVNDAVVVPIVQDVAAWEVRPCVVGYPVTSWWWVTPSRWAGIYLVRH